MAKERNENNNRSNNNNDDVEKWRIDFTQKNAVQHKFNCYFVLLFLYSWKHNNAEASKNWPGSRYELMATVSRQQHTSFRCSDACADFLRQTEFSFWLRTDDRHTISQPKEAVGVEEKKCRSCIFGRTNKCRLTDGIQFFVVIASARYYYMGKSAEDRLRMLTIGQCRSLLAPLNVERCVARNETKKIYAMQSLEIESNSHKYTARRM